MKSKIKVTICLLTIITILSGFSLALAQEEVEPAPMPTPTMAPPATPPVPLPLSNAREGFSLSPANGQADAHDFTFKLKAGESVHGKAFIKNFSENTTHFFLYGADPTVSNTGSPAYEVRDQSTEGPGSWIVFKEPELELAGDEDRLVEFTVTVPAGTEPGEYRAGVTMEKTKPSASNPGITIATRVVNRAEIHVVDESSATSTPSVEEAKATANPLTWQTYYFWISFALFLASLALLIWSIFARGNKRESHRPHGHKPHAKKKRGGK